MLALIFGSLAIFSLFDDDKRDVMARDAITNTKMEEPPIKEPDLTNPDEGLDSTLQFSFDSEREADENSMPSIVDRDDVGANPGNDFATNPEQPGPIADPGVKSGTPEFSMNGLATPGLPGGGGLLNVPGGLGSRDAASKEKLLRRDGGSEVTEAAVGRSLVWLAKQQMSMGYWEFDGSHKDDRIAATGMAILPFLAAGETHLTGTKYRSTVAKGLEYLKSQWKPSGQFGGSGMYAEAIATIAICEAAGMTQDDKLKRMARASTDFIVRAQAANGSWGYTSNTDGDTSIVGWQIQALKSAKLAGIAVPEKVMERAEGFLLSVSDDSERSLAAHGYRTKGSTHTLSAVGLLSRMYIKNNSKAPWVARGVKNMWEEHKPNEAEWDMYYYYYATQVVHFFDGKDWRQNWNPAMRKLLLDKQLTAATNAKPADIGSWPKDNGFIGSSCGKLGTTCLACLTLEVYYRHLPLGKREAAGGLNVLEGKNK